MKILFLICSLFSLTNIWATTKRTSSVLLGGGQGPDDYKTLKGKARIGINDHWLLYGGFFRTNSGIDSRTNEELISNESRIGIDYIHSDSYSFYFEGLNRQDPYEIQTRGAGIGADANMAKLWNSKKATTLGMNFEKSVSKQDVTLVGRRASVNISQETETIYSRLYLDQELSETLSLQASYAKFQYDQNSSRLSSTFGQRRVSFNSLNGVTYGLPDYSKSASVTYLPLDWFDFTLSWTDTTILPDNLKTKTFSVFTTFYYQAFSFSVNIDRIKYDKDLLPANDDEIQFFSGLDLKYSF